MKLSSCWNTQNSHRHTPASPNPNLSDSHNRDIKVFKALETSSQTEVSGLEIMDMTDSHVKITRLRTKFEASSHENIRRSPKHGRDCPRDVQYETSFLNCHIECSSPSRSSEKSSQKDEQKKGGAPKRIGMDVKSQLKDEEDHIYSLSSKVEQLRKKQKDLKIELQEKKELLDSLKTELEGSNKKQIDLDDKLEEEQKIIDSLRRKLEESTKKQNDLENKLKKRDDQIDSLRSNLDESRRKQNEDLRKDSDFISTIMTLKSTLEEKKDVIVSLRSKLRQLQNDEQRKTRVSEKTIETLESKLQDKGDLIDSLKIKLEESRKREDDHQRKIEKMKIIITILKNNLRDKEQLIDSLRNNIQEPNQKLSEQRRDLQQTIQILESRLQEKGELIDSLKLKLEESRQHQNKEQRIIDDLASTLEAVLRDSNRPQCSQFSYAELQQATNGFESSMKIGEGGYGSVYKGFLHHTAVAIKKLDAKSMQGISEFHQEVYILTKLRHQNVVNLMGACLAPNPCLVYEFLQNGSLDDRLECKNSSLPLSWQTRVRIARDICSALIFLHSHTPNCVVHGDLNPSNILLDGNLVAKLGDFGICHLLPQSKATTHHTEPRGTFSYIDPEFMSSGVLTTSSDVYSFGVTILQLLTGRPALGLIKAVQDALAASNLQNILDKSAGEWPYLRANRLAHLGIWCCKPDREGRAKLENDIWPELESMFKASSLEPSSFQLKQGYYSNAPSYFCCPILQEVMIDPQVAADGFTYEAEAIKGWLDSGHSTSPMTNLKLRHHGLLPNRALRSVIQEWQQQQVSGQY